MRVLFLIRSLTQGGAERQLATLAAGLVARGHDVDVAVLYGGGALESDLVQAGVRVHPLGKRGPWDLVAPLVRLDAALRRTRPHILHSYLDVANVVAALARLRHRRLCVVWGLRASDLDLAHYGLGWRIGFRLEQMLSGIPHVTLVNSEAGRRYRREHGFRGRLLVVPNGIDTDWFCPDVAGRARSRAAWGWGDAPVVGHVARVDPMKDHETFLRAAAVVQRHVPRAYWVSVGDAAPAARQELERLAADLGLEGRVVWLGPQRDMASLYPAFDVLVSSSAFGEGFPNVLGEAMASGVPCVATDVGDSAHIVAETGTIVPPRNPAALAEGILAMLKLAPEERAKLGEAARHRIVTMYGERMLIDRTEDILASLLRGDQRPATES